MLTKQAPPKLHYRTRDITRLASAPHGQIVVQRQGSVDQVSVEVEALPGVAADRFAAIAQDWKRSVKSMSGSSTEVTVKEPGAIPRLGEAVRARDLRPKGG